MDYQVLKLKNLYGVDDDCKIKVGETYDKKYIENFGGIRLLKGWGNKYYVYMGIGFATNMYIANTDTLTPPEIEDIMEEFDDKNTALKYYDYLVSLTAKFGAFTLPDRLTEDRRCYVRFRKFYPPRKGLKIHYTRTLFEFMDGVSLSYTIYSYKEENSGYRIKLNNAITICLQNEDDLDEVIHELTKYVESLVVDYKELPKWFKLSNTTYHQVYNSILKLAGNKYCGDSAFNKKSYYAEVSLKKDDSSFWIKLRPTTNNGYYWGENCKFNISAYGIFGDLLEEKYEENINMSDGTRLQSLRIKYLMELIEEYFK